jgi:hypothetical protein
MLELVALATVRCDGVEGVFVGLGVVAVTEVLGADALPAESTAATVYVCVLPGVRPPMVALVPAAVPTTVEPSRTLKDAAGSALFVSVQDRLMLVLVVEPTVRLVGTAGVVVGLGVVAVAAALCGDSLPAASTAVTVYVCVLPAVRPLTVALVAVLVATTVVPS